MSTTNLLLGAIVFLLSVGLWFWLSEPFVEWILTKWKNR